LFTNITKKHLDPSRLNPTNPLFVFINSYLHISAPSPSPTTRLSPEQIPRSSPTIANKEPMQVSNAGTSTEVHTKQRSQVPQRVPRSDFSPILQVIQEKNENVKEDGKMRSEESTDINCSEVNGLQRIEMCNE
jgi:hypothetical protein